MKLAAVRSFAMGLPQVTEEPHHDHASFRVRGRIFVTVPPGEAVVHVFVPEDARDQAVELHAPFVEKLMWGGKVVGVRVRLERADPGVVRQLVLQAWRHKAPKSLQAGLA